MSAQPLLQPELYTLGWFCGYMAGEINRSEDNDLNHLPITDLAEILIAAKLKPFVDFVPYPGRRIVVLAPEKFAALPEPTRAKIAAAFDLLDRPSEELQRINQALREELNIALSDSSYYRTGQKDSDL